MFFIHWSSEKGICVSIGESLLHPHSNAQDQLLAQSTYMFLQLKFLLSHVKLKQVVMKLRCDLLLLAHCLAIIYHGRLNNPICCFNSRLVRIYCFALTDAAVVFPRSVISHLLRYGFYFISSFNCEINSLPSFSNSNMQSFKFRMTFRRGWAVLWERICPLSINFVFRGRPLVNYNALWV